MADKIDVRKELKSLEKEFDLEEVKIKKDKRVEKAKGVEKDTKAKKTLSWKKRHAKWFKTKPPRGKDDIPFDKSVAGTIVSLPFDYWATSRHPVWKLDEAEEARLAQAFIAAFGQFIPWFIKQYFPVIAFFVLYLKMIEDKRKIEARLIFEDKINEFSPRQQKKILKKLNAGT